MRHIRSLVLLLGGIALNPVVARAQDTTMPSTPARVEIEVRLVGDSTWRAAREGIASRCPGIVLESERDSTGATSWSGRPSFTLRLFSQVARLRRRRTDTKGTPGAWIEMPADSLRALAACRQDS